MRFGQVGTPRRWVGRFLLLLCAPALCAWESEIVHYDEDGKLRYVADEESNLIPDFSYAGYRNSESPIPEVPVVHTVGPVAGDNTAHLQAAIDLVGAMELGADGFRGALLLEPGLYEVTSVVNIPYDGVVLRGAGDGSDLQTNTVLRRTGYSGEPILNFGGGSGNRWRDRVEGTEVDITTSFVQVGDRTFDIEDASGFSVGDNVVIFHPCTQEWLDAIDGGGTATDPPWTVGSQPIYFTRYITRIEGNRITVDAPVFNDLRRSLSQSTLFLLDRTGLRTNLGLENVRVEIAPGNYEVMHAIRFSNLEDAWARGVTVRHFLLSGILLTTASRVTVEDMRSIDPRGEIVGGMRYNFMTQYAQLALFKDTYALDGRHNYGLNGTSWDSGNVFLRTVSEGAYAATEGHRRWSTGLLWDNHEEVNPNTSGVLLGLYNRGSYGTGHGWSSAHSVAWRANMNGGRMSVQKPPTAQNYSIGSFGDVSGDGPFTQPAGYIEGTNMGGLVPESLFEAQLAERLSAQPDVPPDGYVFIYLRAVESTFVRGGEYADINYGSSDKIVIKEGSDNFRRESFLRFDLSAAAEFADEFIRAELVLYPYSVGMHGILSGVGFVEEEWDSTTMTWEDRPAVASIIRYFAPYRYEKTRINITETIGSAVGGEDFSIGLFSTGHFGGPSYAEFHSANSEEHLKPAVRFTVPLVEEEIDGGISDGGRVDGGISADGGTGEDGGMDPSGEVSGKGCSCRAAYSPATSPWFILLLLFVGVCRSKRFNKKRSGRFS